MYWVYTVIYMRENVDCSVCTVICDCAKYLHIYVKALIYSLHKWLKKQSVHGTRECTSCVQNVHTKYESDDVTRAYNKFAYILS